MRDFYAHSAAAPLDQAEGLRQLFAGRARQVLALAANPYVSCSALVLDRLAAAVSALGRQVLVVDAAASAPAPHELVRLDLAAGIEPMMPGVAYLPARGLPLQFVDTRGSAARFMQALFDAVPSAEVVLLHAEATELARVLARTAARPLLLAADHPESLKSAYASCKLLRQRTGLATFDLLLAASAHSPRLRGIVSSLRGCADSFLGALVQAWSLIDPAHPAPAVAPASAWVMRGEGTGSMFAAAAAGAPLEPSNAAEALAAPLQALEALVAAQLALADEPALPSADTESIPLPAAFRPHARSPR